jgi:putative hemolysin
VAEVSTEIIIVLLLILFNSVLALSEMAVVSARRVRLEGRARQGSAGARVALELAESPNRFLSTVQIGITLVGILAGAFGGAALSEAIAGQLEGAPLVGDWHDAIAFALVVIAITYLSLVIGELVPKRIALQRPEAIATLVARPMQVLSRLASPIVGVLSASTDTVLGLLRVRPVDEPSLTEEEIRVLIGEASDAGVIESEEEVLVERIFHLGDRRAVELMTPRHRIAYIDIDDPFEETLRQVLASPHTTFPVCDGGLDTVLGSVSVKELWAHSQPGAAPDLRSTFPKRARS